MESNVVRVDEVAQRLECSKRTAYSIIRQLNAELKAKGYITLAGRVPRKYFEQKCKISTESEAGKC